VQDLTKKLLAYGAGPKEIMQFGKNNDPRRASRTAGTRSRTSSREIQRCRMIAQRPLCRLARPPRCGLIPKIAETVRHVCDQIRDGVTRRLFGPTYLEVRTAQSVVRKAARGEEQTR